MEKVREKTLALMSSIDEVFFKSCINSRNSPQLKSLARVFLNVLEYLDSFSKFCENGKQIDELLNNAENGQENANGSGQAE